MMGSGPWAVPHLLQFRWWDRHGGFVPGEVALDQPVYACVSVSWEMTDIHIYNPRKSN